MYVLSSTYVFIIYPLSINEQDKNRILNKWVSIKYEKSIDKKLIDFIIKRIDRSYSKISDFIYKIDELSLKKKKPIDFKTIKEILKV